MAKVQGLTIGIGVDTKEFNKGITRMNKEIRGTSREVYQLQKSLDVKFDAGRFATAQKKAQEVLDVTDQKAKALRERLKFLESEGSVNTNEYKKLQSELNKTEAKAVVLKDKLDQIKEMKIEALAKKFETVGEGISKAGQALAPFSAAAAALLGSFAAIGMSAIKAGDNIGTTAQQLNISTEALQRWQYVAQQTDVDISQLENGIRRIQMGLGGVASGELDETSKALVALGITQEQALKGMDANFENIIYQLSDMEDATLQAHYANELFGRRMGAQMIPLLNDGGEGLRSLINEFETFNYLTDEQVQSLDAFEDTMDKIKFAFTTMKNQLGSALLPLFQEFADTIQNRIIPAANRMTEWFTKLSIGQQKLMFGTAAFVASLAPVLLIVGKMVSGIGGAIRSFSGLSKAMTLLAANPIIAIVAVLAGLMIYLYKTNEQFRNSIQSLVGVLSDALGPILGIVTEIFQQLIKTLSPVIDAIGKVLTPVIGALIKIISPLINALSFILIPVLEMIVPIIGLISKALNPLIDLLVKILVPAFEFFGKIVEAIFKGIEIMINGYVSLIESAINKIIDFINKVIGGINKIGDIIGYSLNELDNISMDLSMDRNVNVNQTQSATQQASEVAASNPAASMQNSTVNNTENDYSTKNITVNLTVETQGEDIDYDDLVNQINIRLAEQM